MSLSQKQKVFTRFVDKFFFVFKLAIKHPLFRVRQLLFIKKADTGIRDLVIVGVGGFARETVIPNQSGHITAFVTRRPERDKWLSKLYSVDMFTSIQKAVDAGCKNFYITISGETSSVVPEETNGQVFYCEKPLFRTRSSFENFKRHSQNIYMVMLKTESKDKGNLYYFKKEKDSDWLFNIAIHYIWDLIVESEIKEISGSWKTGKIKNSEGREFIYDVTANKSESKHRVGRKEISQFLKEGRFIYGRSQIIRLYNAIFDIQEKWCA